MEDKTTPYENITKHFSNMSPIRMLIIVAGAAILLGTVTGYILFSRGSGADISLLDANKIPTVPQQDTRTFRDFAEGTIQARPQPKNPTEYVEGTHLLAREGAVPVALTSSVVDLSKYEGKKVKVFGETQKAIKEGWLMDVGKIEEIK